MIEGVLVHALVCLEVVLVSHLLAMKMFTKYNHTDERYLISISFGLFWFLLGLSYLCIGLYLIIAAYHGTSQISSTLLYWGFSSLALITAPLAFFIIQILIGDKRVSLAASCSFMMVGLIFIFLLFRYGVDVADIGSWSVDFKMHTLLLLIFIYGSYIPAIAMIMALIPFVALKTISNLRKYKITMSLISLSLAYDFTLLGVMNIGDFERLLFDVMILIGALIAYLGYFPPDGIVEWLRGPDTLVEPVDFGKWDDDI
ncbi:MAG TPA: hypothetical protein ENG09_06980 [Candidatus Syntrophoarchaeum butanivorans]|uniref:Uncharacterized protein n=1 Tax=Candidatus Syntropharchaeum butanivorans TaxID=1839936 RepID=A0A7C0X252_9EURY|nr:hypothetical protein [Candidatus Syntrophoarchaeum butanivorans]